MSGVPSLSLDTAAALVERLYGLTSVATALPSERDQNFLITAPDGGRFVLKLANASETRDVIDAECDALRHLAATSLCPRLIPTLDQRNVAEHDDHFVRLITAVSGQTLGSTALHGDALRRDIGRALGTIDARLASFDHPAFHRTFHWDLAHATSVVREHLPLVRDAALRECIATLTARHEATVDPLLPSFRRSIIHSDANDYNVLVDAAGQRVTGIIDLGDMVYSHVVNDVAIAMAYVALSAEEPLAAAASVVAGYHAMHPLTEPEISSLFSLMCMRLCVSACMAAKQQAARPDDAYLGISQGPIGRTLPALAATHPRFAHYTLRQACGLAPVPHTPALMAWLADHANDIAPVLDVDLRTARIAPLDFSVGSPLIASEPADNAPAPLDQRVQRVLSEHGADIGVGGYEEARLIYDWEHQPKNAEPRTIHMGIDLSLEAGAPLFAPLDATVHSFENADTHHDFGPMIVLQHQTDGAEPITFFTLYGHLTLDSLDGLQPGQRIAKGQQFARIGCAPINGDWWAHVHVQLITDMLDVPCNVDGVVRASQCAVWRSIFPDPNAILCIPERSLPHRVLKSDIADSRSAHIGRNLSVSYGANPLNIVRGYKQYLYDENAHRYIDAYNNVAHVGHAHPRVVRAVSEQLAVLNTNTRYLQHQLTAFAEQLTALLPESLSVAFFTASGSEANELALRMARAHTHARDLIVMDAAYHGHTTTLIDISPYKHDGPGGEGRPDWVHTSPIPDVYRARDVVGDPGAWFAAQVGSVVDHIGTTGRKLSAYIAETCPSVGGQILMPPRFLRDVYARVRAAGGLCIADEVQTGFGRMGTHFWAFEAHDVVPDIVVLGKPIANGYPMGAVITTRAIADSFNTGMEYFSTFGGSTAACVAGLTTLQVTLDEKLQDNARTVGNHLLAGLRPLMSEFELVGDVRGSGLFLGVELVHDRTTLEPAASEASFVVNRMRANGVLAGTDGPHHNVIKLRGPMPLTIGDADRIVESMTRALREVPSGH
jgi:4-aminobutyrate aminotransferase-like enzyme/Ser/Thr protein kinase RdoA (MazF antagonist)